MFKYIIGFAFIGAICANDDVHAKVNHEYRKVDGDGHFEYGYDLTNGIAAEEHGDVHGVHGEYHWVSKEGVPVKITYTADENGYHPHGDLLPTAPPTPAAILKSLKYIEEHPPKPEPVVHHPPVVDPAPSHHHVPVVHHEPVHHHVPRVHKTPDVVHHKPHHPHQPPTPHGHH